MKDVSIESSTMEISGSTLDTVMLDGRLTPPVISGELCLSEATEVILRPLPDLEW